MKLNRAYFTAAKTAATLHVRPWLTNDIGRRIYVDPRDRRAWRMARAGGALDRDAVAAWREVVVDLRPDLVLDIGANYGEVVLAADYPNADVHVFEPNPHVADRLERSVRETCTIHRVAASDCDGHADLSLVPNSSGLSSLARHTTTKITVPTLRIDSLRLESQRLLFKIDVEGHEHAVLRGMKDLLASCEQWIGLVEGDLGLEAPYIRRATSKDVLISSHPI